MATINMSVQFDLNALRQRIERTHASAQNLFTAECKKAADVFTPMYEGNLKHNFEWLTDGNLIIGWSYIEPYARRQWYGMTKERVAKRNNRKLGETKGQMVAARPFNYSRDRNPNARARWTEHAANTNGRQIINAVIKAVEDGII